MIFSSCNDFVTWRTFFITLPKGPSSLRRRHTELAPERIFREKFAPRSMVIISFLQGEFSFWGISNREMHGKCIHTSFSKEGFRYVLCWKWTSLCRHDTRLWHPVLKAHTITIDSPTPYFSETETERNPKSLHLLMKKLPEKSHPPICHPSSTTFPFTGTFTPESQYSNPWHEMKSWLLHRNPHNNGLW